MSKRLTELVFILDKSGSMGGLETDTIGGYNAMLSKQQALEGEARLTTVLFDHDYELLHDRIDIRAVNPITDKEYVVGGTTALLDAIGRTICKIDRVQSQTAEEYRADRVLFIITTDGQENASREYDRQRIQAMVERQKAKYGWEFLFLGANIDAVGVAASYGIAPSRAQNYKADSRGTRLHYEATSEAIAAFRQSGTISDSWSQEVEADYNRRGGSS